MKNKKDPIKKELLHLKNEYLQEDIKEDAKRDLKRKVRKRGMFDRLIQSWMGICRGNLDMSADFQKLYESEGIKGESIKAAFFKKAEEVKKDMKRYPWTEKMAVSLCSIYDFLITEIIKRDLIILLAFKVIQSLNFVSIIITFMEKRYILFRRDIPTFTIVQYILLYAIQIIFNHLLEIWINSREDTIRAKIKRSIQMLIYEKLAISSIRFLEHSDNNMIYRLWYSIVEDYSKYKIFYTSLVSVSLWIIIIIYACIMKKLIQIILLLMIIVVRLGFAHVIEYLKHMSLQKHLESSYDLRKGIYEFISNFKSFHLKKLKQRFINSNQYATTSKLDSVSKFIRIWSFETLYTELVFCLALLYSPLVMYINKDKPLDKKNNDYKLLFFEGYFSIHLIHSLTNSVCHRLTNLYGGHLSYQKSKVLLGQFFNQEFEMIDIKEERKMIEENPDGDVVFENCDILQRNMTDMKNYVELVLGRSSFSSSGSSIKDDFKKFSSMKIIENQTSLSLNLNPSKNDGFRLAISGFNLRLSKGTRLCVLENNQDKQIRTFIDVFLRESFIADGKVQLNSSVSYFNPNKSKLITGKTIRENIIFGRDFDQERYDETLKIFDVQFGNYQSFDYHQVAENGLNIRTEDARNILFARFLYQDCDVYIIEEYFTDLNLAVMKEQIRFIIKHILQHKTIIFCSNSIELIKLANQVLIFNSESQHSMISATDFLEQRGISKQRKSASSYGNLTPKSERHLVLRNKVKNSVFFANISFEEELAISKRKESQSRRIESFNSKKPDILAQLAFGIYLVQKKRQEGLFFDSEPTVCLATIERMIRVVLSKHELKSRIMLQITLQVISLVSFSVAELLVIKEVFKSMTHPTLSKNSTSLKMFTSISIVVITSVVFKCIMSCITSSNVTKWMRHINNEVQKSIMNSKIQRILRKKHHIILSNLDKNLCNIELDLTLVLSRLIEGSVDITVSIMIMTVALSLTPLPIILTSIYLFYSLFRSLIPVYIKICQLNSTIESKIDDLNFQLLSLIGGYRIAGRIQELLKYSSNLCDRLAHSQIIRKSKVTKVIGIFVAVNSSLFVIGNLILVILCYRNITNFFKFDIHVILWGILSIFRPMYSIMTFPYYIISLVDILVSCTKVFAFIEEKDDNSSSPGKEEKSFKKKSQPNFSAPIIFKNVSLTTGVQPILKKISMTIKPFSKVAVFGVNGGSRSSLFNLIMKVLKRDPTPHSSISIFGQSIDQMEDQTITNNVFFIERSPILFEGTLGKNLDPFSVYSQNEIQEVLLLSFINGKTERKFEEVVESIKIQSIGKSAKNKGFNLVVKNCDDLINSNQMIDIDNRNIENLNQSFRIKEMRDQNSDQEIDLQDKNKQNRESLVIEPMKIIFDSLSVDLQSEKRRTREGQAMEFNQKGASRPLQRVESKYISGLDYDCRASPPDIFVNSKKLLKEIQPSSLASIKIRIDSPKKKNETSNKESSPKIKTKSEFVQVMRSEDTKIDNHKKLLTKKIEIKDDKNPVVTKRQEEKIIEILDTKVAFEGKNINYEIAKCILFSRALLEKPKILLTYEEALSFGQGVEANIKILSEKLEKTTVLVITKEPNNLLSYSDMLFVDSGMLIEQGDPAVLIQARDSFLHRYLDETDFPLLENLKLKSNLIGNSKKTKPSDKLILEIPSDSESAMSRLYNEPQRSNEEINKHPKEELTPIGNQTKGPVKGREQGRNEYFECEDDIDKLSELASASNIPILNYHSSYIKTHSIDQIGNSNWKKKGKQGVSADFGDEEVLNRPRKIERNDTKMEATDIRLDFRSSSIENELEQIKALKKSLKYQEAPSESSQLSINRIYMLNANPSKASKNL